MTVTTVWAAYFSPTGTARTVTEALGKTLAHLGGLPFKTFDFTLPKAREAAPTFTAGDLVVLGSPVYAGRIPNLLAPYIASFQGGGALGVPVVLFGNRAFDDALMELRNLMEESGFRTLAAGGFIGEHSFGRLLGTGRPDGADLALVTKFAGEIWTKLAGLSADMPHEPVPVPGNHPVGPYYRPRGADGNFIDIRRVHPETGEDCIDCKSCARRCPMGSIPEENVKAVTGVCIKCNACVKGCPVEAKFFTDPNYLFHRDDLVEKYAGERKAVSLFL